MFCNLEEWENNLVIRIPKSLIDELGWSQNTRVRQIIIDGKLVVEAVQQHGYSLEQLLEGVTTNSLHGEVDTGPAIGKEI